MNLNLLDLLINTAVNYESTKKRLKEKKLVFVSVHCLPQTGFTSPPGNLDDPNIAVVSAGRRGKDDRKKIHWPRLI
jgi:hypothetical protein